MLQYISEHFTTFVHITGKDPRHAAADALSRATPFMTSIPAPPPTDPASSLKEEKGVGSIATNLNHVEPPAPHVHSDTSQGVNSPQHMYNLLQGKVPLDVIHLIQSVHNTHRGHLDIDATCNAVKQANDNKSIHNLKQLACQLLNLAREGVTNVRDERTSDSRGEAEDRA